MNVIAVVLSFVIFWIILAQISRMKKVFFSITILLCCVLTISGCIKHPKGDLTINPTMTAYVNYQNFVAATVTPALVTSQVNDTTNTLIITGNANLLQGTPGDQIILTITNYKNTTGTFSLIKGEATETYIHKGVVGIGTAGIVSITSITSNSINGYFSFTTYAGVAIQGGAFSVGMP